LEEYLTRRAILRMPEKLFNIDYDLHPSYRGLSPSMAKRIKTLIVWLFQFVISFLAVSVSQLLFGHRRWKFVDRDEFSEGGVLAERNKALQEKLSRLMKTEIAQLEIAIANEDIELRDFETCIRHYSRKRNKELLRRIEEDVKSTLSVKTALSSYFRKVEDVRLVAMNLHINQESDRFVFQHGEEDRPDEKMNFFHCDTNLFTVKAMIYLSEVRVVENGAFEYIVASHKVHSPLKLVLRRALKKIRAINRDEESKLRLLCLPKWAREKNEFSDYASESELGLMISSAKQSFFRSSNLIVFNPLGLHRGGRVSKGKRIALQLVFATNDLSWRIF